MRLLQLRRWISALRKASAEWGISNLLLIGPVVFHDWIDGQGPPIVSAQRRVRVCQRSRSNSSSDTRSCRRISRTAADQFSRPPCCGIVTERPSLYVQRSWLQSGSASRNRAPAPALKLARRRARHARFRSCLLEALARGPDAPGRLIKYVLEFSQGRLARVHQRVATSENWDFGYPRAIVLAVKDDLVVVKAHGAMIRRGNEC